MGGAIDRFRSHSLKFGVDINHTHLSESESDRFQSPIGFLVVPPSPNRRTSPLSYFYTNATFFFLAGGNVEFKRE